MPGIGPWLSISIFSIEKNVGLNLGLYAVGTRCLVVRINESLIHILQGTIQFQFHFHIGINIDYTKTLIPPWYDTSKEWKFLWTKTSDQQDTCSIWDWYPQFLGSMIITLDQGAQLFPQGDHIYSTQNFWGPQPTIQTKMVYDIPSSFFNWLHNHITYTMICSHTSSKLHP